MRNRSSAEISDGQRESILRNHNGQPCRPDCEPTVAPLGTSIAYGKCPVHDTLRQQSLLPRSPESSSRLRPIALKDSTSSSRARDVYAWPSMDRWPLRSERLR